MSIIFVDSADHYSTLLHKYNSISGGGNAPSTTTAGIGRNSTAGIRMPNSTSVGIFKTLSSNPTDFYYAMAYKTAALPTAGQQRIIMEVRDAGTRQLYVSLFPDGQLRISRGGNSLVLNGTQVAIVTGFAASANIFYHFEWYGRISSLSSVGLLQFRVNEVERLNATGITTSATGSSIITQIGICSSGDSVAVNCDVDDIIVRDDRFSGDQQVKVFFPTGVGFTDSWLAVGTTFTYQAVDETAPNDDTDYISEDTVGDTSLFTFGTIAATAQITAVVPIPRAKKTDAGTAKFKTAIRHSGTTYLGTEQAPSNSSYDYFPEVYQTNPGTGITWTTTDWNSIEIGVSRSA